MGDIYAYAQTTKVWLGPADHTSAATVTKITEIGRRISESGDEEEFQSLAYQKSMDIDFVKDKRGNTEKLVDDMFQEALLDPEASIQFLKALHVLLFRPYWSRVWILQETILTRTVIICWGELRLDFEYLYAVALYADSLRIYLAREFLPTAEQPQVVSTGKSYFSTIISIEQPWTVGFIGDTRKDYHNSRNNTVSTRPKLIHLLTYDRSKREATDLRDTIWALLGLAADAAELHIIPDYTTTNSFLDVSCCATRAMILTSCVDALNLAKEHREESARPSWVPNWREKVQRPGYEPAWLSPYSAFESLETPASPIQSNVVTHLTLSGYILDTIETLRPQGDQGPGPEHCDDTCSLIYDIRFLCALSDQKYQATGQDIYAGSYDRETTHQGTPIADVFNRLNTTRAKVAEYRMGFEALKLELTGKPQHSLADTLPVNEIKKTYLRMLEDQKGRTPFLTVKGYVGLAPEDVEGKDIVVEFPGAVFPYVLRKCEDGMYVLVGGAYVHGVMYGEFKPNGNEVVEFVLR